MPDRARVRANVYGVTAEQCNVLRYQGLAWIQIDGGVVINMDPTEMADQEVEILRIAGKLASEVAEPDAAVSMLCGSIREALARDELVEVGQLVDAIEGLTAHRAAQVPA